MTTHPFVITYWGSRGGGMRLTREAIIEILETTQNLILTSCRANLIADIVARYPDRIINYNPAIPESKLYVLISFRQKWKSRKLFKAFLMTYKATRVVILMSHPWDVSLQNTLGSGIKIYRVIHDLKKHPGERWPSKLTIRRLKKSSVLIALSKYIYIQLRSKETLLASLSRINYEFQILRPMELDKDHGDYVLIIGRDKKYQSMKLARNIVLEKSSANIVTTIKNEPNGIISPRLTNINRWLGDDEVEYLIKNTQALICIYAEASQSGIIEQGKYWGVPILVSNVGALPEQISGRPNCKIIDPKDKHDFAIKLNVAISEPNLPVNWGKSMTVVQALHNSLGLR